MYVFFSLQFFQASLFATLIEDAITEIRLLGTNYFFDLIIRFFYLIIRATSNKNQNGLKIDENLKLRRRNEP